MIEKEPDEDNENASGLARSEKSPATDLARRHTRPQNVSQRISSGRRVRNKSSN